MLKTAMCALSLAVSLSGSAYAVAAGEGPREQLQSSVEAVIAAVKDRDLDSAARRQRIREVIDRRFDFRTMSRGALSVNWRRASEDQRSRFVERFSELVQRSYIGRIEAYTDERVAFRDVRMKGGRAEIDTVIVADNADIPIRYKMRRQGGDWLVYDVVIEEVSLVRNYRSSYRSIVKREGLEGLMTRMDERLAELATE